MQSFQQEMEEAFGARAQFGEIQRGIHATDASHYQIMPSCVFCPLNEAETSKALKIAASYSVPTTARGAGTSLSGQTHGPGLILDVSRHMNQLLEINAEEGWARVQPGLVRDHLNAAVAPLGLQFAPDPATSSRATVGGMIGNNSSGTRSVVYGKTSDHLLSCRVALADGRIHAMESGTPATSELDGKIKAIVDTYEDAIRAKFPKVMRRVSGYALDAFLDPEQDWNLNKLICGSEGTLGVLTEATLRLVPLPKATVVAAIHFGDVIESLKNIEPMLAFGPSTIELLDDTVLVEAQRNSSTRDVADFIEGHPKAMQLVEFMGDSSEEAQAKADAMVADLKKRAVGYAWPVFADKLGQSKVWDVRRLGLGLITNVKGATKGQAFVEDACIPLAHLPTYIERLQKKCADEEVQLTLYAHSSVGVLHARPALDLHKTGDIAKMKRIADFAFGMCIEYGGAWAGEHGDGLVRGEFIARFFGPEVSEAFRKVKGAFDPNNLMNPGKLIDPPPMTSHLRYQQESYAENASRTEAESHYNFRAQGGLALAVEQCNGVGACRKIGSGVMCPSYMATRDEKDVTRARANALRLAMSGQLFKGDIAAAMASDEMQEVMGLCLSCKACANECPNAVDIPKMKAEVLQKRYDVKGTPLGARITGTLPVVAHRFAGPLAPVFNFMQNLPPTRAILEKVCHIDRRRPLPQFATSSLQSQLRGVKSKGVNKRGELALYIDSYTNAYDPHIGQAALNLLAECGYEVFPVFAGDSQRARLSKGLLREAKKHGEAVMRTLDTWAERGIPILCIEPSCASALKDDLPDLLDDEELGERVSQQIYMIDEYLWHEGIRLRAKAQKIKMHGHCHQKSVFGVQSLQFLIPDAELIDAGCCGMAGAFGYEHRDLSLQIGEDRLFPAVRDADEDTEILASGFSCRHQVEDACGILPKHFAELVEPA